MKMGFWLFAFTHGAFQPSDFSLYGLLGGHNSGSVILFHIYFFVNTAER